ncbi:diaminobutyrate acetyltransferase [Halarcobacter mediterraneus]|uniref:L-2,4-diaminobutyric acid acetyltransferase n=1 Tax=Halarcobacter mediterraneus TaxID=2023153 RepID=A0A4Q1AW04_9BACT|nr:diaminobutyrate acetyltransferase [Halarcobacter mediterraneus]RXK12829.1 diaminobutyrate acetyltransferase [Halarcobacter mediterraneus]
MRDDISIRKPRKQDGKKIHELVKSTKVLDVNSEYLYLLQATHFSNLCSVAICEEEVIGFVSGYMIPNENNTLFIWQVAVDENFRGNDLARRLILDIVQRKELNIKFLHTTVSPSNNSSIRVFEKVAKHYETQMTSCEFFTKEDFNNQHEEEVLYKIGPFK